MCAVVEHGGAAEGRRIGGSGITIKNCDAESVGVLVGDFCADGDNVCRLGNDRLVCHAGDERGSIGLSDGIWEAGGAVAEGAWTPILGERVWQGGVDELERRAKAVLSRVPFPTLMGVDDG